MERINHSRLSYVWHQAEFLRDLEAQVAFIHCHQVLKENQIAIRFGNGYGVTILPVSLEEEIFEVLVLRFYGPGINDYQVAQYAPIPELNRGDFKEIIDLCQQVALLPISKARTDSSGQAKAKVRNNKLERRCGNFL
jgi:hypothetical protein